MLQIDALREVLNLAPDYFLDSCFAQRHGRYFGQTRSQFLCRRSHVMALMIGFILPFWIVVDYFLLPDELFNTIALQRIIVGGLYPSYRFV
jgi:hypothetical protein